MNNVHVFRPGESPAGPFSEEEVRARLERGELTVEDYAWHEGMAEWLPLTEVVSMEPPAPVEPITPPEEPVPAPPRPRPRARKRVPTVHAMTGLTEFLEVFPDRLVITPKGGEGLKTNGSQGIRTIEMQLIRSIGFKLPTFTSGSLEFGLRESGDGRRGQPARGLEANVFRFMKDDENVEKAAQITEYVEDRIRELRSAAHRLTVESSAASMSEELGKLAVLREQGTLTAEEFQQAKRRLLAGE